MNKLVFIWTFFIAVLFGTQAYADDWSDFKFEKIIDDFTDEVSFVVYAHELSEFEPKAIAIKCSKSDRVILFDPGVYFSINAKETLSVRFDKDAAIQFTTRLSDFNAIVFKEYHPKRYIDLIKGFEEADIVRYKIGKSDIVELPLRGSTAAMKKYNLACSELTEK